MVNKCEEILYQVSCLNPVKTFSLQDFSYSDFRFLLQNPETRKQCSFSGGVAWSQWTNQQEEAGPGGAHDLSDRFLFTESPRWTRTRRLRAKTRNQQGPRRSRGEFLTVNFVCSSRDSVHVTPFIVYLPLTSCLAATCRLLLEEP